MNRILIILAICVLPWTIGCQKSGCPAYITSDGKKVAVCKPVKNFSNKRMKAKYARTTKTSRIGNPKWNGKGKKYKANTSSATAFRDFSIRIKRKRSSSTASATASFSVRIKRTKKPNNSVSLRFWPRKKNRRISKQARDSKPNYGLFSKKMKKGLHLE